MKKPFKILSPTGILGYGFPEESFINGINEKPDLIAVDAGSVDPGPYYLGAGKSFTDRIGVKRDLRFMLKAGIKHNIPVIVGTCGGSGAKPHLDWTVDIVKEIAKEEKLSFKAGIIYADIDKNTVLNAFREGRIMQSESLPELSKQSIRESVNIVTQMGVEPIINALDQDCQVILAGRAYDPSVFAALPIKLGYNPGLAIHLGKILECAAIAADPGSGADCVLGILEEDSFILQPLCDIRKFTKYSVAAHTLYEKSDPYHLPGPGGALNLDEVTFEELEGGKVRVKGSKFKATEQYYLKLEAVRSVGFRCVSIAGIKDPIMINDIDSIVDHVKQQIQATLEQENISGQIHFHLYGKNGVMGAMEPSPHPQPEEIGILIEVVSNNQKNANTICSLTRSTLLHYGYPGRISTAGNLALPFSPSDIAAGEVFEFSLYHLMATDNPNIFNTEIINISEG